MKTQNTRKAESRSVTDAACRWVGPRTWCRTLKNYKKCRENGAGKDAPKKPLPSMGFENLDIEDWKPLDGRSSDKWPDKQGRYCYELKLKDGTKNTDFYCKQIREFKDGKNNRCWEFLIGHRDGAEITGFTQKPNYEKGFPDSKGHYWCDFEFNDEYNPAIREWMEEKDLNYLRRIQKENPELFKSELTDLKSKNPQHPAIEQLEPAKPQPPLAPVNLTPMPQPVPNPAAPGVLGMWNHCRIDAKEVALVRKIAAGGFGEVWLGDWYGTQVAVKKLLSSALTTVVSDEFKQEAKIMVELKHPNIVQFYGVVTQPEQMMVLEFMAEGSLYDVLHSKKPLSWQLRYNIGVGVARGVFYLHGKQLLHRDLKSLNVLLDSNHQAKLADFGLTELKAPVGQTATCGPVGTVRWMAPELFEPHGKYRYAADVYSMAIVLWELMSRKIPHEDIPNNWLVAGAVCSGKRDAIPQSAPQIMRSVTQLCWAQKPEDRPTAEAALEQLRAQPVTDVTPVPSPYS